VADGVTTAAMGRAHSRRRGVRRGGSCAGTRSLRTHLTKLRLWLRDRKFSLHNPLTIMLISASVNDSTVDFSANA